MEFVKKEGFWEGDTSEKIIYYLFLALAFFIPLIFYRGTYDQFDLPKITFFRVVSLAIIFFYLTRFFTSKRIKVNYHSYLIPLLIFLVSAIIATILSIQWPIALFGKYRRFEGSFTFFLYVSLVFIFLQTFKDEKRLFTLVQAIVFSGAISSIYGILQYFRLDPLAWGNLPFEAGRSFSTMGNPALLGGLLAVVFPLSLALALGSRKIWEIILYAFSSFLIFFCLITSFNRAAWIATAVGLIVFAFFLIYFFIKKAIAREVVFNFFLFFLLLLAFVGIVQYQSTHHPTAPMNVLQRAESISRVEQGSFAHRIEIWKAGLQMVKERPLFGWGPDTYRIMSRVFQTYEYTKMTPNVVADNAHCFPLQLAAGTGLIGAGSFYIFLLFLLVEGVKILVRRAKEVHLIKETGEKEGKKKRKSKKKKEKVLQRENFYYLLLPLGIFLSFFDYSVHLLASVSIVGSSLIWWLMFGAILCLSTSLKEKEFVFSEKSVLFRTAALVVLTLILLIGMIVSINHFLADYYLVQGIKLFNQGKAREGFASLNKAVSLNPYGEQYKAQLGRVYLELARITKSPEYYRKAEEALRKAIQTNPMETDPRIFLADTYRIEGSMWGEDYYRKAIEEANGALRICKYLYSGYLIRGLSYLSLKEYDKAIEDLKKTVDFYPDLAYAWFSLGEAYKATGNIKEAKKAFAQAAKLQPDNEQFQQTLQNLTATTTVDATSGKN